MGSDSLTIEKSETHPRSLPMHDISEAFKVSGIGEVWFSLARHENAASIHIMAKSRNDKLMIRDAANAFCDFVFDTMPWCEMICCLVTIKTTENLAIKCGFKVSGEFVHDSGGIIETVKVLVRAKNGLC